MKSRIMSYTHCNHTASIVSFPEQIPLEIAEIFGSCHDLLILNQVGRIDKCL